MGLSLLSIVIEDYSPHWYSVAVPATWHIQPLTQSMPYHRKLMPLTSLELVMKLLREVVAASLLWHPTENPK